MSLIQFDLLFIGVVLIAFNVAVIATLSKPYLKGKVQEYKRRRKIEEMLKQAQFTASIRKAIEDSY